MDDQLTDRGTPTLDSDTVPRCGFTDAELVAALPNLRRCARALRLRPQDVDDFVHEAVVRALRSRDRYQATEPLVKWLTVVAYRAFYSGRRHEAKRPLRERGALPSPPSPDPEARRYAREVAAALAALPPWERDAVLACAIGTPLAGVPIGTQRSRAWRGRDALRRAVDRA